jgi:hypothetical protein
MSSAGKSLKAEAKAFAVWFWFEAIRRGCLNYMINDHKTRILKTSRFFISVIYFSDGIRG